MRSEKNDAQPGESIHTVGGVHLLEKGMYVVKEATWLCYI